MIMNKSCFFVLVILMFSCDERKSYLVNSDKYSSMESEFLDELIESDLIISAEGFINSNIIYSLYDTLLSFDNLGVDEDAIKLLLEENEVKNYNYIYNIFL